MKRNKIMFVIAIVAILAVLFVACDEGTQPEHTHTYGAWSITTQPTETATGTATRACACGDVQTATVAKLSDASVWTVTVNQDATHETAGFKAYKSADFGTITVTVPKGEHAYGAWEISKEPTETETGIARRYCACGHYDEAVLAVLTNTTVWTKTTEGATHSAPGKEIYTSEYGVVTVLTSAEQHVYGEWTSNNDGTHSRVCSCGDKQTENCVYNQQVAAPAFLKTAATCTTKAEYYVSCVCGAHSATATFETSTALGHDYTNYQVKTEPTCTEAGEVTAVCSRCDDVKSIDIPALGHDHDGGCIPYVNKTGDYDEEDGSNYHIYICSRCGEQDKEHKEEHTFGEKYFIDREDGEVVRRDNCTICGYVRKDMESFSDEEYEKTYGTLSDWTVTETVKADYNQAGYIIYTYKEYTYRKEIAKLVAPYEGTTYYAIQVKASETDSSAVVNSYKTYKDTYYEVTFDENGKATGDAFPFRGENTICITDATTGALTYTRVDGSSTLNDTGYIDLENGVIVHTNNGVYSDFIVMIPTSMTVTTNDVSGSHWTDSLAFSYSAICSLNETHTFNVFVYDEKVYFGVQYVDMDGKAIAAGACSEAPYVKVLDAEGNKIQAFAQKNGSLTVTDGKEGTYTSADNTLKFDGVGGFVLNGENGFYTAAAAGASYGYDAYVGESVEKATAYYQITLGENNTCTIVKPESILKFDSNVADVIANINIVKKLPTPSEREGYVFNGWKLNGEGEAVKTFVATVADTEYSFVADWSKKTSITVEGLIDADKDQYSVVYIGVGNAFLSALPDYDGKDNNGYKFVGWYLDSNNDGVLDEDDTPLTDNEKAEEEGKEYHIFASWEWQGNVEFVEQTRYNFVYDAENGYWKSNNKGVSSSEAIMYFKATEGVVSISFEYYVSCQEKDIGNFTDYLEISYGTDKIRMGGLSNAWTKFETTLEFNSSNDSTQSVKIRYAKNGQVNSGDDTAYIRNLTINGVAITAQNSLNKYAGTYTSADAEDINVMAGGTVVIGDTTYTYTNVSEKVIGVMVGDVYKEYTLNTADMTYTVVEPKVTIVYDYNEHGTNTSAQVGKYSNQTLSTETPTADGYIFRGWYTNEACTTKASATFVASADVTFYAKWDAAITLTYVYLDGTTADHVENLYANDTVKTLQAVDFDWNGKKFAGWFTKDGSTTKDWGDEFVANTTLTNSTTVYAKWVTPHALMGDYTYGANLDPSESGIVKETDDLKKNSYSLYIDAEGNVTGGAVGSIKDYNAETGTFYVLASNGSKYYGGYNAATKTIYVDYAAGKDSAYHDIKFAAAQIDDEVPSATFNNAWDNGKTKLVRITYKNSESVESYRYILIYGKSIYSVTSWSATDASGAAVTDFTKIYSDANLLTIVCGETTIKLGRKNNNFTELDGYQGTYTFGDYSVTLDGIGNITGVLEGTYTKAADDAGYTFDVKTTNKEAYKLTVNKEDGTCTYTTNTVEITYVNDKKAISTDTAFVGIQFTLPSGDAVAVEGYIFRGWYTDAQFSGSAVTKVTLTENATYYAKYDAAVTLTFDYSGYEYETGKTTQVVTGKYINDTVGTLPTIASSVRHNGQVFAGWYFKEGETWGDQATSSTKLTEEVVTIYARWIEPAAATGTYKGFEIYTGWSKTNTKSNFDTTLTINADGKFTGKVSGTMSVEDRQKVNGAVSFGRYGFVNVEENIVLFAFGSGKDSWSTDLYIVFKDYDNITSVAFSATNTNSKLVAWVTITYSNGTVKNHFIYNDAMYANVSWKSGTSEVSATDCSTTDTLVMYDSTNKAFLKKSGSAYLTADGKEGSYNNVDVFGEVILDGYGTITVSGQSVAYTLNEDKTQATFVLNNQMRVIALGNGTYTLALDEYKGIYKLLDDTDIYLDGYGKAGDNGTYVVNGTNITIYEGGTSTTYGLDIENKKLLGKSKFAGLTFSGTGVTITFDDDVNYSGIIKIGSGQSIVTLKFTATFDGTTLTMSTLESNGVSWDGGRTWQSAYDFNSKVIVATLSGNTFTVVSSTTGNQGGYPIVGKTATSADYQG